MFEYIKGEIKTLNPSFIVMETGGIGYFINISLHTYSKFHEIQGKNSIDKIYIHQIIREDAQLLYGFFDYTERDIFTLLLSVSGVGANTARMILSSLTPEDIKKAVSEGDVNTLKNIKGIGAKSAQRIIVDLKDKILKTTEEKSGEIMAPAGNTIKNEALTALVTLGFSKSAAEKTIEKILTENKDMSVEALVKEGLKRL